MFCLWGRRAPRAAVALDGSQRTLVQGDFAYAEVKKLDPDNSGHVWCDIKPGRPVTIADQIVRVTADDLRKKAGA